MMTFARSCLEPLFVNTPESAAWQVTLTPLLTPKDLTSKKSFCLHRETFNHLYSWKEKSNMGSPC